MKHGFSFLGECHWTLKLFAMLLKMFSKKIFRAKLVTSGNLPGPTLTNARLETCLNDNGEAVQPRCYINFQLQKLQED